jgi:short-subunit dehydrogenase
MEQAKRLDVLVNNAGYVLSSAIEETSLEEAKSQFETNFFGIVRMVNVALPIMRQQRSGQIINISSLAGVIASPFEGFYSASKFAIEGYSEALRHEVRKFNIYVSVVEPGFFRTNIGEAMRFPANPIADYADMHGRVLAVLKERTQSGPGPEFVANTILRIIESKSPGSGIPWDGCWGMLESWPSFHEGCFCPD